MYTHDYLVKILIMNYKGRQLVMHKYLPTKLKSQASMHALQIQISWCGSIQLWNEFLNIVYHTVKGRYMSVGGVVAMEPNSWFSFYAFSVLITETLVIKTSTTCPNHLAWQKKDFFFLGTKKYLQKVLVISFCTNSLDKLINK